VNDGHPTMMRLKEFEPGATMDRSLIIAVNRLARRHPVIPSNFFESEQY
jgi:hypothetical protein